MENLLKITTLGGLSFNLDSKIITGFTSRKAEALLIYIAFSEKEMLNREELASLLWEESPESEALLNLRVVLSNLKKLFSDYIQITRRKVGWKSSARIKVDALQIQETINSVLGNYNPKKTISLADAKTILKASQEYRGDFLQGFYVKNSIAFENWLMYQRESLKTLIINASHLSINSFVENKDIANGITLAKFLINLEPYSELAYRKLMHLYALSGQFDAAVDTYNKCSRILLDEFATLPEEDTTSLYNKILNHDYPFREQFSITGIQPSVPPPQNLPKFLDPLIGRDKEIILLSQYLEINNERLISLIGQGGIGKTRLAIEAVQKNIRYFRDGVWFISCANVLTADLLMPTIAKSLGITLKDNQEVDPQVIEWLDDKKTLLILDNFEALIEASTLITALIDNSNNLRFLITSREPLTSPHEKVILVEGLDYPDLITTPLDTKSFKLRVSKQNKTTIKEYASVKLFITKVSKYNGDFHPDSQEILEIAHLCHMLGGSPLAIELAAACKKTLSTNSILSLIQKDLSTLRTDKPESPERQRSLLAVFEAFWNQLSKEEQNVVSRLSVFRGTLTIEAAKAISDASPFLLSNLVARGLMHRVEPSGYQMHSVQRQFIAEKLAQDEEKWEEVHVKYQDYFFSFLNLRSSILRDTPDRKVLNEIELVIDNIRSAIDLTIKKGNEEKSLIFCEMLMPFWKIRGYFEEGYYWLDKTLSLKTNASPVMRSNALCAVARLVSDLGNYQKASDLGEESLTNSIKLGNQHGIAKALNSLGAASSAVGEYKKARQYYIESLEIYRNLRVQQAIAGTLNKLAALELCEEKYQEAIIFLKEALVIFKSVSDNVGIARVYNTLSRAYLLRDNLVEAYQTIILALSIGWDLRYWNIISYALENYANYLIKNKQYFYSVKVLVLVESIRKNISYTLPPHEQKTFNKCKQFIKNEIGVLNFEKAVLDGKSIILEDFINELLISGL